MRANNILPQTTDISQIKYKIDNCQIHFYIKIQLQLSRLSIENTTDPVQHPPFKCETQPFHIMSACIKWCTRSTWIHIIKYVILFSVDFTGTIQEIYQYWYSLQWCSLLQLASYNVHYFTIYIIIMFVLLNIV